MVYYFHGNVRCPTCRSIETQAEQTVRTRFATQLDSGEITWKIVNYEQPAAKPLALKFDVQMPVVVLARMKDGQVQDWRRLDKVWALVGDKPGFAKYVQAEVERMLASEKRPTPGSSRGGAPKIPIPK